ncbi:MAG: hypothetical protein J6S21_06885, partial [Victivallales bacterium]|nr:hypothetical protein [Victivallales bacterium]
MSDIYPDTSLRLRRQVSNQEWVNTVARRHRAAFIGSIIFHLYLIFFSPKLQQAPTFEELCTSPVWLWLIGSILAADWVHCLIWRLRRRKVNSGHLGIMRWTWIDLICILTPVIPAYFFAVHDVLRIIIGLCTVALTCYAMIRGDRILWRYHIEELRAKLFTRLSRGRREVMQNGAWSLGLGLGLVTMLVYNGGQDYTSALPPMPRILRGAYVIFSTAVMIRALFLSFIQVYWQNLEREQIIDHSGFFRKLLRLMRVLPFSFWLTGISFFSAGFFFFTDNGAFVMPAMLCFHGAGCLFIHNAHSHALQREENRIMEWLLRHPAIMVVASFMMLIATGTYLLSLPFAAADGMQCLSTVDALFTATSASCVTGLSVITISSALSNEGVFVLAALIQLGGLGIMTISSFVALALGHRMGILESSALADMNGEQMGFHAKKMTRAIVSLTLLIEAIGTLIFLLFFYLKPHYIGGFSL